MACGGILEVYWIGGFVHVPFSNIERHVSLRVTLPLVHDKDYEGQTVLRPRA